ncbi:hypothetical protein [Luteimonas panaciterrae]|uniref:hypothetical protein n=1 Tax=Luteimonas panaciterrae TaxID=363885 RepID=UPI001CFA0970|nr:hypothetical protein [Luteimonas panaciterrae]
MSQIYKPLELPPALPIESTFDCFVLSVGGVRMSSLVGQSPPFANADYLFPVDQVIVELKELTTDWPRLPEFQQRISNLWLRCLLAGRISDAHLEKKLPLPMDVHRDFMHLLRKPLKRILEKANKQIKETRHHLGFKDHQGVVMLVADGLLTVAPQYLIGLLAEILLHDYSGIDCLVILTVNEYVDIPGDDFARLLWVPTYADSAPEPLVGFIDNLGRQWFSRLQELSGPCDSVSEGPDRSFLEGAHYIDLKGTGPKGDGGN